MDYTTSNANIVHGPTGNRMHQSTEPVTTEVSARDLNMVIWSLMKLLADAGVSAASFDPANAATYNRVSLAVQALGGGSGLAQTGGAFVPSLRFGGASTGIAYATQQGQYSRIGNHVHFWVFLRLTSKGSATGLATVDLGVLPNAASNYPAQGSVDLMTGLTGHISGMVLGTTNDVQVRMFDGSGSEAGSASNSNFTNTTDLYLCGSYLV